MKLTELFYNSKVLIENSEIFDTSDLRSVNLNKKLRKAEIFLNCNKIIKKSIIMDVASDIRKTYNLKSIKISTIYDASLFNEDYFDEILYFTEKKYPHLYYFVKDSKAEISKSDLNIFLKGNGVDILLYNEYDKVIENLLSEEFSLNFNVSFIPCNASSSESQERIEELKKEAVKKALIESKKQRDENKQIKKEEDNSYNTYRYQKTTYMQTPISDISEVSGKVEITGDIFKIERKDFNNSIKGKVTFYITDYKSSVRCQFIAKKPDLDTLCAEFSLNDNVTVCGETIYESYVKEYVVDSKIKDIEKNPKSNKIDNYENKRVELHLHTNMSAIDGVNSVEEYINLAKSFGHKALAVTDHGVVQAFPDAYKAAQKSGIKLIYGVEGYLFDDMVQIVRNESDLPLDGEFVVFDIETTGFDPVEDRITEIGACKIKGNKIIDNFSTFVNPEVKIPQNIVELTGITDEMVKDAPKIDKAIADFIDFCGSCPLIAHNADFDMSFIKSKARDLGISFDPVYIDTLELSRTLLKNLSRHKLNIICEHFNIDLKGHHRAVNDAAATAEVFFRFAKMLADKGIFKLSEINKRVSDFGSSSIKKPSFHIIILVQNKKGLYNLYKLISKSHIDYFYKTPRIPRSELIKHREGLIIGSACEAGELYRTILNKRPYADILKTAQFYDYFEVQPLLNNKYLIESGLVKNMDQLIDINKKIIELGEVQKKPVVATGDVHFIDEQGALYRAILMSGKKFKDADNQPPLYYRTTEEMLNEFTYLDKEKAYEIVITNTNYIANLVEDNFEPIPSIKHPPVIDGAAEEIKQMTLEKAHELYGNPLPSIVEERINKELNSIINNGFSVMYLIAQKLVAKSISDGYLVGSRGSVGSSLVAFLTGITEVNSLCAHYICENCKYTEFITDQSYGSGYDLPDKKCPKCNNDLKKDGHNIPFETFLGFEGDKEPDIDLNFSGEYQPIAHKYIEELFGEGHVFRAGTIGTIAEKTAFGYVKNYFDERNIQVNTAEIDRLVLNCTGAKATTGQHPGGIMIIPKENDVHEFTPIQHPANEKESGIITTHFDYHKLHDTLLKLDILGHDDPTMLKMLRDLTGLDPTIIPLDDPDTMSLFTSTKALNVSEENLGSKTGTLGVPEFGTKFVRQMLEETKPKTFEELVRISGLSHGTDVWINNAQDIIKNNIAPFKETICTRDDIMIYLIHKGLPPKHAFSIMERVRKGKGLSEDDIEVMTEYKVPKWYIESCIKIKYMFPKAHAVAYVTMAFRVAYYKVHYPLPYYCAYFSVRADDFDAALMTKGREKVLSLLKKYNNANLTAKEKNLVTILEICNEMYLRGFDFLPVDIYKSDPKNFIIENNKLRPPLTSIKGLGLSVANNIEKAREEYNFFTVEDFIQRTKASSTVVELLSEYGCFKELPESSQLTLF